MKKFIAAAGCVFLAACLLAGAAFASGFTDTEGHWASASIERWADAGVVDGIGGNNFDPDGPLTEGQAAQILSKLLRLTDRADLSAVAEISGDEWYADAFAKCLAAGILTIDDGRAADEPISRADYFVVLAKALGIGRVDAAGLPYTDTQDLSEDDAGYIAALTEMGVIHGIGNGILAPDETITRAEAMTALDNLVGAYITGNGPAEAAKTGITLIVANDVTLSGDGPMYPVVVSAANAKLDLSGIGPGVEVDVLTDGVTVSNAPEGVTVTARAGASGTTLDGETVPEASSITHKVESILYDGAEVRLSEKALYVNASLTREQLSDYAFNSLQDCVAAAKDGEKGSETVIYLAPDVYWTDDYANPEMRGEDDLVGLEIPQRYIFMVGVTGNRDDVVIASDRGQNAGADGNFNTIAISDGFHAKDVTFANYCNVDLVYKRNPSKNHAMRQGAIVQAQVITKAKGVEAMDEWFFEDCAFVSRLNVFSNSDLPGRTLYERCHFESTDDSIGTGYISVFEDCDFDFYSNTPSGSASDYLQAYLNCDFRLHFAEEGKLNLAKHTRYFAILDTTITGNAAGVEWRNTELFHDMRNIVSGNTLNGEPLTVSPSNPEYSITPGEELMTAFKVGDEYNVYNLLNNAGFPEWDPLGQKETLGKYAAPWEIRIRCEGWEENVTPELVSDGETELVLEPTVLGLGDVKDLEWSCDNDAVKLEKLEDGKVSVTAVNYSYENITACVTATAKNGLAKVMHIALVSPTLPAPQVADGASMTVGGGEAKLTYSLSKIAPVEVEGEMMELDPALNPDASLIEWYRGAEADGSDKLLVAVTTYVLENSAPKTTYTLTDADVGCYLTAVITPGYLHTEKGVSVTVISPRAITAGDVTASGDKYSVNFSQLGYNLMENASAQENYEWETSELRSGFWYGGFYLPAEYREGGVFANKAFGPQDEIPWTFAEATNGAAGTAPGLQTTTQGARIVYVDDTRRGDMSMTVTLAPHKNAGQGFGSANQFMDIYIKYDARTMTGYGLRITREQEVGDDKYAMYADYLGKCCSFQLMEFVNGKATPLGEKVYSSAFNPEATIVLSVKGKTLSASVTTTKEQGAGYPEYLKNEVSLEYTLDDVNAFSGFGFQHTGTAGEGKSGNRVTISGLEIDYT